MEFRVVGISDEISGKTRETMKSPQYGHPAFSETANGYGPCRSCLGTFETGKEERILFTYNAFEGVSNLPSPGPVFIHMEHCERFDSNQFPEQLRRLPNLFEGYGENSELIRREGAAPDKIEKKIIDIFSNDSVKYINVRNADAGCFIARIERI
jgi:hypothetical protein